MKKIKNAVLGSLVILLVFTLQIAASSLDQAQINYFSDLGFINQADFNPEAVVTEKEFNNYLNGLFDVQEMENLPLDGHDELNYQEAVIYLVNALDQKEFLATYAESSSDSVKCLQAANILALFSDLDHSIKLKDNVTKGDALQLIITALKHSGEYYEYLGELYEPEIYGKVYREINKIYSQDLTKTAAEKLFDLGNKGLFTVSGGIFTGYSIKDLAEKPLFDFARTIRYGHSSISHLSQLISVLRREGFDARIQVETRVSSYVHLIKEWGEPSPSVLTTPVNDEKCIVHANEYDLLIEFSSMAEKEKFAGVIEKYSKKDYEGEEGLIKDSWFVPLFTSSTPLPGFVEVSVVKGKIGRYCILSYALNDVAQSLKDQLAKIDPEVSFEINKLWINEDFISYLDTVAD